VQKRFLGHCRACTSERHESPKFLSNIECTVHAVLPMGDYDHLLIGRVHVVHIRADLYEPYGHIDHLAMAPIGRLAGTYSTVDNLFTTPAN